MSKPHADRNLLFGILALQMDFISRDALVSAMNAWVLSKEKPLGEILLGQGALRPDAYALLEGLVAKHLELHGHDAERSLAALSSLGSVREQLRQVADPEVEASLAHVSRERPEEDPHATRPLSAGEPTSAGLRFRILRPHARGGLGEVFVARDEELRREVALKEIRGNRADDPESRARFLLEAEVTGGLEHPGIVPVYGLGTYADGRPYYAMRFIKGDTLHDAIKRFHNPSAKSAGAGERSVQLRKLLGRFLDVCNAMEYAHSRGVLHRDLKPGNIMLGKYGETLVVDWGLAKPQGVADATGGSPEGALRPGSASAVTPTLAGGAVGTPEYMSPEQAEGRSELLGPASDVYGLGATLYCLLTGHAPCRGEDTGSVLRQVQRGEFPRPRAVDPGIPAVLEAVCLKAMALKPEDRYASPRALADDVEDFLADEPVTAYRDPLALRLARWGRRHRTLVTAGAALLLTATAALAVGLLVVNAEKNETARARQRTQEALDQVSAEKERAEEALAAKAAALERSAKAEKSAAGQRQLALKTVRGVVDDIEARLKDRPAQAGLRQALLGRALAGLKEVARAADTAPAIDHETVWAHLELGDIFLEIEEGGTAEAKRQYQTALDLARQVGEASPESAPAQRDVSVCHNKLGDAYLRLGDDRAALDQYRQGLEVRQRLADADKDNAEARRDLAVSHGNLGDVYMETGDYKAALESYKKGLEIDQRLADADPASAAARRDLAISHENLGDVYLKLGERRPALDSYKHALELCQRLADADRASAQAQRDLNVAHNKLGDASLDSLMPLAALGHYQKGLEIARRLADADKASVQAQRDLAASYQRLGDVYRTLWSYQAAQDRYQDCHAIVQRLADADKASGRAQRDLAESYRRLGDVSRQRGDRKAALDHYQKGLDIAQPLGELTRGAKDLYDTAAFSALCAPLADKPETREEYAARAVGLLRQAIAKGYKDTAHIKEDADLDALRRRDDFKKLVADLEAATKPKDKEKPQHAEPQ
jgi:serine/threonine-protein kinase